VTDVGERMQEIRLRGPALATWGCAPGAHVVVHVPTDARPVRRVYSVWQCDPQHALLCLRLVVHPGTGPGSTWAQHAAPGDPVDVEPPRSKISIDVDAAYHLFVGDETGAVPLLAMSAAIHRLAGHATVPVLGVLETATAATEMPGAPGVPPLPWAHRGRASAVASPVLVRALRELRLPPGIGTAYLAGEASTCRMLARHLIESRGWPRRAVQVQPQWAPGQPGFGAGPTTRTSESGAPARSARPQRGPRRW